MTNQAVSLGLGRGNFGVVFDAAAGAEVAVFAVVLELDALLVEPLVAHVAPHGEQVGVVGHAADAYLLPLFDRWHQCSPAGIKARPLEVEVVMGNLHGAVLVQGRQKALPFECLHRHAELHV